MQPSAIELKGIAKSFGANRANDGISFRVEKATIHGIVGENGAGKSTAMKILFGMITPDEGEIFIQGAARRWKSSADAIAAGLGMVHQHFMLAGPLSVLDNIIVGAEMPEVSRAEGLSARLKRFFSGALPVDRAAARAKLEAIAERYALPLDWDAPVETLSVGLQQRVEIIKLLYRGAEIMILDEPTAVLTPKETEDFFNNLKKLKSEGKTILVITHKLKEVMSHTDHVTVFRSGRVTGDLVTSSTSPQELADKMVGRRVALSIEPPGVETAPTSGAGGASRKKVLDCRDLTLQSGQKKPLLNHLSLQVYGGEIVGVAGVEGNGQSELIRALLHPRDPQCRSSGSIELLGQTVTRWSSRRIRALKLGVIPQDRHQEALLLQWSLQDNFLLGLHRSAQLTRRSLGLRWIRQDALCDATLTALHEFDIRPRSPEALAAHLSGGDQQKLIISREFAHQPEFLIAAQPTRGVDVGAIEFIHQRILSARSSGAGVLLISSELDEILTLSDRIVVVFEGAIIAEYQRADGSHRLEDLGRELGLKMGGAR